MNVNQNQVVTELIHQIRFGLRIDRLGTWSKALDGIRLLDLHILKLAAEQPDIILKEIRQSLAIPHSTLTSAVDRLEKRHLLRRTISQRDRRSYGLELTEKGWRIRKEHGRIDQIVAETVLEALSDDQERETLTRLLAKINERLS